ncbi:MAG: DUF305 domain-containing protein [Acidimicrobiia bacterium]|nr:DUF305 domain-containing protein [Acidimicrobiia bacterium]
MRKVFALFAVLSLGALAAACGGDDSDISSAGSTTLRTTTEVAEHNDADVAFAEGMIPHHAQAVEMAEMAVDVSLNDQVIGLAQRIQAAQQPEIDEMTGWLEAWGEPVEASSGGGHGAHGGSGGAMAGMMSEEGMAQLGAMDGAAFDRMWLDMMIRHHEGAIEMAKTHQAEGEYPNALMLGEEIITAQEAEITEMRAITV